MKIIKTNYSLIDITNESIDFKRNHNEKQWFLSNQFYGFENSQSLDEIFKLVLDDIIILKFETNFQRYTFIVVRNFNNEINNKIEQTLKL